MLRMLFWGVIYFVLLGSATIRVDYSDGLHINFKGWLR